MQKRFDSGYGTVSQHLGQFRINLWLEDMGSQSYTLEWALCWLCAMGVDDFVKYMIEK